MQWPTYSLLDVSVNSAGSWEEVPEELRFSAYVLIYVLQGPLPVSSGLETHSIDT